MTIGTCNGPGSDTTTPPGGGLASAESEAAQALAKEPVACGDLVLSTSFTVTPAAAGQAYLRCDTQ
ncbi:MAG TPA: hypothetical protein VHU40_05465, partial [Polyangia bacterium]|nr:hypothetical protein [Polyangia bacterium]